MRTGISFIVSPTDRRRLTALIKDRNSPIGRDVTKLTYWILGSFFLRVADRRAMVPVQMIAADGTKVAIAADYHFAVTAFSDYREERGRADGLRADYLKDKIDPILKRLSDAPGGDTDKFRDSYQTAERIADELVRRDRQIAGGLGCGGGSGPVPGRGRLAHARFLKRQLSLPVSTMSQ